MTVFKFPSSHFQKEDIGLGLISSDTFTYFNGVEQIIQRRCPVLKPDAYPTVFPSLPSYLSAVPIMKCKDLNKRASDVEKRHVSAVLEWLESDLISDLKDLSNNYETKLEQQIIKGPWHHTCLDDEYVLIYILNIKPNRIPSIALSIKIVQDMSFNVYIKKCLLDTKALVAIQMDEIYVKSALNYTGGKLIGTASNTKESATTVQAFMISPMFSNYTEVVGLIPMKNMTAGDLQTNLLQTIQCVQSAGFTVLVVIADNNAVNRRVYKELCAPDKNSFDNPQQAGKQIFLLHDSVHLLKCIWHNWLNQKDADQTFTCPSFPLNSGEPVMKATLSSLISVYSQDRHNIVKLAPALTHKALYPSNLDRQKVSLALGVFNDYNVAALRLAGQNDSANFINIILQWWKIVNVKSKFIGMKTRQPYAQPVTKEDRSNLLHLMQFRKWLEAWQKLDGRGGKLTTETFHALTRSLNAVIQVSEYALNTLDIEYILLGKLQTDNLEARFGEYRQLSGANYLVSVQQILEAEKKLKIYSVLHMCSSSCGDILISDLSTVFNMADSDMEETTSSEPTVFKNSWFILDVEEHEIVVPDGTVDVLVYISGFVAFRASKRLKCSTCCQFLQQDKSLTVEIEPDLSIVSWLDYTRLLDRGGLKYPSQILTIMSFIAYLVVQTLISPHYEHTFLTSSNHKEIVIDTVAASFHHQFNEDKTVCTACGCSMTNVLMRAIPTLANIFLNNYRKRKNDTDKDITSKRRKLGKFTY